MKTVAMMYSGGTDSTAATALIADRYDQVHLVTCSHSGLANIENSGRNIARLRELFGPDKFVHVILNMDRLFKKVTFARYGTFLRKYGFFNLTSCGLCKLAMHVRTLIYCLDRGIVNVADGANRNMSHFPAQMAEVIGELQAMYAHFGIDFTSPVFDYDFPDDIDWFHKLGLASLVADRNGKKPTKKGKTTGQVLRDMAILPEENVKGTPLDQKMQGRCFQLTLLNNFALGYYIPKYGMDQYRKTVHHFYKEKIELFITEVERYLEDQETSDLHNVIAP